MNRPQVSLIIPCLNEEETIGICIEKAKEIFLKKNINAEIIVADNGSTDKSQEIALRLGARVVSQSIRGYGAAYLKGIEAAEGKYIIMGDGDNTYDFREIPSLLEGLDKGYDFVIGSRFRGKILKGAMPFANRYIGNPILTGLLNIFYKSKISYAHSGFRALTKKALDKLGLKTTGMEFASEMIVAAFRENLKILEVPIIYHPRGGESKLNPFYDAWRHVKFLLLFSPTYLFLIPGGILFILGLFVLVFSGWGKLVILGHKFDIHAMIFASIIALLGFQIINLGIYAKAYSFLEGLAVRDKTLARLYHVFNLEKGIALGALFFIIGAFLSLYIVFKWIGSGFGPLNEIKAALVGLIFLVIGIQTIFSSFFLSLLLAKKRT